MARLWSGLHAAFAGAGPMLALQLAGYWAGFGLIAATLVRDGRRGAAVLVVAIALWPLFLGWQAVVLKDGQMVAAMLAATGLLCWHRHMARDRSIMTMASIAALLVYAVLVRANAIFAVAPLVAMLGPRRSAATPIAIAGALTLAALALSPLVNHRLFAAEESRVARTQPLYDLAGIAVRVPPDEVVGFTPAEARALVAKRCVTPFFWDPLGEPTRCEPIVARLHAMPVLRLYALLAEAMLRHPAAYAAQRLAHLNSTWRWWVPAYRPNAAPPEASEPNDLGLGTPGALARAWQRSAGRMADWPTAWPILWIVAAIAALAATRRIGSAAMRLPRALLLSALGLEASFAAFSIASDLRYHLWPMIATALALALIPWRDRASTRTIAIGMGVLLVATAGGMWARSTLPPAPTSYAGMLG